jgi:Protein of unknown function (DUF2628)
MATYSIYAKGDVEDAIFVRDGFSWGAFVFAGFWALWHRMWIVAVLAFVVMMLASALPWKLEFLLNFSVSLVLGVFGNDLRAWSLARHGFAKAGLVDANNLEDAELQFYATMEPRQLLRAGTDILGLFGAP